MSALEAKEAKLQKFNITFAVFLMILLFFAFNSNLLFAQNYHEVGLHDPSIAGLSEMSTESSSNAKIYQNSTNVVKFDITEASYVKVGIYDFNNNLVRTYIYNNLQAGTYELNFTSGNLEKGTYTCVLTAGDQQESSKMSIE